jgi:hypothetical protein
MSQPPSTTRPSRIARLGDLVHLSVFLGLLWLPLAASALRGRDGAELKENRALAPAPRPGVDPLATLAAKFDRYYNDHFGLRNELIRAHDLIMVRGFRVYHTDRVAVGDGDWLFFIGDHVQEDCQGLDGLSARQLRGWQQVLEGKQAWLAERGIEYLFVVAPNKESIYGDRLPDRLRHPGVQTRLDQLLAYLHAHSTVPILDLRPVLRRARQAGEVYFPLDTHWNDRGAIAAYHAVCAWLKPRFPHVEPLGWDEFRVQRGTGMSDLCSLAGWHGVTRECDQFVPRQTPCARTAAMVFDPAYPWPRTTQFTRPMATERPGVPGRLLVFHDSFFAHRVRDLLAEHFGRTVCLSMRADHDVLSLVVRQERPQMVIEEWVERSLVNVPTAHPQWIAAQSESRTLVR